MSASHDPTRFRSVGLRFLTSLGSKVQLAARDDSSYHFVEWATGVPARHTRVRRDELWTLLEGAELLGRSAEA